MPGDRWVIDRFIAEPHWPAAPVYSCAAEAVVTFRVGRVGKLHVAVAIRVDADGDYWVDWPAGVRLSRALREEIESELLSQARERVPSAFYRSTTPDVSRRALF